MTGRKPRKARDRSELRDVSCAAAIQRGSAATGKKKRDTPGAAERNFFYGRPSANELLCNLIISRNLDLFSFMWPELA